MPRRLLSFRVWVFHPITRATDGLLGPCYKTGRLETTFMHQSFASKQYPPAKTNYIRVRRSVVPMQPTITSNTPTRGRCSIPPSSKRLTSYASVSRSTPTFVRATRLPEALTQALQCKNLNQGLALALKRREPLDHFLLNGFTHYLTLIPKFFSTFHHCTFSLSVSCYI